MKLIKYWGKRGYISRVIDVMIKCLTEKGCSAEIMLEHARAINIGRNSICFREGCAHGSFLLELEHPLTMVFPFCYVQIIIRVSLTYFFA